MSARDPELVRLLIEELERHRGAIAEGDTEAARRAVHALKGSAGLAGERELASALARVERRMREGDASALPDALVLVGTAKERLASGLSASAAVWPEPPDDLDLRPVDAALRAPYVAEVTDRLARIDDALGAAMSPLEAAEHLYRQVHTIKGAASAVGDEPMSWFCHGLEERLKRGLSHRDEAVSALQEATRWRGVLGALLEDPEQGMRVLRSAARPRPSAVPPSYPPSAGELEVRALGDEGTFRVATAAVDRLLDRMAAISVAREDLVARLERAHEVGAQLRRLRADLATALRLIGPPRPWGAPAAALARVQQTAVSLSRISEQVERDSVGVRRHEQIMRDSVLSARRELSAMRQTPLASMLGRLSLAVEAEARRSGREVVVRTFGGETTVDRRLVEQLTDPCLHLARNSVAHGIERPDVRRAAGKPSVGTITLSAKKTTTRLVIGIEDDGAGVDVAEVRRRAVETGAVTPALAEAADDNTLLALLFLPGFSTRESSDLLAGRGVGLDIALAVVQRLSGGIRLSSRRGQGFSARVEVPVETGLTRVVWVEAAGEEYALVAGQVALVRAVHGDAAERAPHLAACLGLDTSREPLLALDLVVEDSESAAPVRVGVDAIGVTEEQLIRPLTPLVAAMGPFAGAIVRGDGSLRIALDGFALAPRARALGRLPGVASERPRAP